MEKTKIPDVFTAVNIATQEALQIDFLVVERNGRMMR